MADKRIDITAGLVDSPGAVDISGGIIGGPSLPPGLEELQRNVAAYPRPGAWERFSGGVSQELGNVWEGLKGVAAPPQGATEIGTMLAGGPLALATKRFAYDPMLAKGKASIEAFQQGNVGQGLLGGLATLSPFSGDVAGLYGQAMSGDTAGAIGRGFVQAGMLLPGLRRPAMAPSPTLAEVGRGVAGGVRTLGQEALNVGPEFTRRASGEYAKAVAKAEETFQVASTKHAEAVAQVHEAQAVRSKILERVKEASTELGDNIKALEVKARNEASGKYEVVKKAVGEDTVDAKPMMLAVRKAMAETMVGTPERVAAFNEILGPLGQRNLAVLETPELQPKMSFAAAQGYYSDLGIKMAAGDLPGDLYHAIKQVREAVGKEMEVTAKRNGALGQLTEARRTWKQYEDTFHDMRSIPYGGSPMARVFRAADPTPVTQQAVGPAGERMARMLRQYEKFGGRSDLINQIRADMEKVKAMPRRIEPKAPEMQVVPRRLSARELKEERLRELGGQFRSLHWTDVAAGLAGLGQAGYGHFPAAWAYPFLRRSLGYALEREPVVRFLSTPKPGEL